MTTKNTTRPVYTVASKRLVIPAQEVKILGYDIAAATMVEVASTTSTATPVASFASISAIKTTTTTKSASFTAIPTESRYVIGTSGTTVTLQAADPVGTTYEIWDGSGDAANSVHTITVADGGHTINGSASITLGTNYGMLKITKTSSTAWHCGITQAAAPAADPIIYSPNGGVVSKGKIANGFDSTGWSWSYDTTLTPDSLLRNTTGTAWQMDMSDIHTGISIENTTPAIGAGFFKADYTYTYGQGTMEYTIFHADTSQDTGLVAGGINKTGQLSLALIAGDVVRISLTPAGSGGPYPLTTLVLTNLKIT